MNPAYIQFKHSYGIVTFIPLKYSDVISNAVGPAIGFIAFVSVYVITYAKVAC